MHKFLIAVIAAIGLGIAAAAQAHGEMHGDEKHRPPNLDPIEKPFGRTGDPKKVERTIRIDSFDNMRFKPDMITVKQDETIRFIVRNAGAVMHEAVLGTIDELKAHGEMMKKFPGMEHDEPYMVHIAPGQSGEMIWQFTRPGEFHFGCLIPGHFEAGMLGRIKVVAHLQGGK